MLVTRIAEVAGASSAELRDVLAGNGAPENVANPRGQELRRAGRCRRLGGLKIRAGRWPARGPGPPGGSIARQ
eukprot:2242818-Pyramimonas_sp.AAC.1